MIDWIVSTYFSRPSYWIAFTALLWLASERFSWNFLEWIGAIVVWSLIVGLADAAGEDLAEWHKKKRVTEQR